MGRLCQLRGEFLGGIALDGEAFAEYIRFVPESTEPLSPSNGLPFSFVGEPFGEADRPVKRSNAPPRAASRRFSRPSGRSIAGDKVSDKLLGFVADIFDAVGVFAGEDLVGDIERARSETHVSLEEISQKQSLWKIA